MEKTRVRAVQNVKKLVYYMRLMEYREGIYALPHTMKE